MSTVSFQVCGIATRTTQLASFPSNLNLPKAQPGLVEDAAEAVKREYRSSVCWKRLRCRKVERLSGQSADTIFVLEVGHAIEFEGL